MQGIDFPSTLAKLPVPPVEEKITHLPSIISKPPPYAWMPYPALCQEIKVYTINIVEESSERYDNNVLLCSE